MGKIRVLICLGVMLFGLALAEDIKIGSGSAPAENIFKPVKSAFESATSIVVSINSSGPKQAFLDLDKGIIDMAAAGLSYKDWLKFMETEGAKVANPDAYSAQVIGNDKIKVIVNKANNVKALSKDQLKDIFTGKVFNWKDVGGNDAPIVVVVAKLTAANSFFYGRILDGEPPLKDFEEVQTVNDLKKLIQTTPEAIGIGPVSVVDDSVNSVQIPIIARSITVITKGKPSAKVQKFLDFIKGDGQKLIKK
ncbi:MAG: substrate-binding domain-containing protein [Candidatus Margulisbacteria bacterium]|nr:substrate-binding domain-containing protein [Candidatus Margulisiibacteriota bacterium]